MFKVSRRVALFGLLGIFCIGGFAAGQKIADGSRPTGLKPIDSSQYQKIRETWPRVKKVHPNRLGLERINAYRAKQGQAAFRPTVLMPIGQEVESAIEGLKLSAQAALPNPELSGALPSSVDNSIQSFFPPIGDQGSLNSCLPFATTHYQLSYMSALVREPQTLVLYSPKWTYNMINGGQDEGSYAIAAYDLLEKHGAATSAEFPYDNGYLGWCLTSSAWQNALTSRIYPVQYLSNAGTDSGMEQIKELLNNGYILVFGTYIMSWQGQIIMDDPTTPEVDAEVGKGIGYFVNGEQGSHAMTIVGYNDTVWADVNGNAVVDPGEKGAFKVANSWGSEWQDNGFIWLAYDALRSVSALPDGPSVGRVTAFQQNLAFVMTPRSGYSPSMVAEFTVNHAKRNQLAMSLGTSDLTASTPTTTWIPGAISGQGGAYAFDGSTTAVDGTFVFDFTDLLSTSGGELHYYLGMSDSAIGDAASLTAFKIKDLVNNTETEYSGPDLALDDQSGHVYVTYTYVGPTANHAPVLSNPQVSPIAGPMGTSFAFTVGYDDQDGDAPTVKNVVIDDTAYPMSLSSGVAAAGYYAYVTSSLSVGPHNYRFYFEDGHGEKARAPVAGTYSGPAVSLLHFVTQPTLLLGEVTAVAGTSYLYETGGSICSESDEVLYRFDWGDGVISDWLSFGQVGAAHVWSHSGPFAVKAQARCAVDPVILSSWSNQLIVTVPVGIPFSESFVSSGFPAGWVQQNIGTDIYNGWVLSPSSFAGGQSYEMSCTFEDVVPGVTRLVTPPINTIGYSQLRLRFKHFLKAWQIGGAQLRIQTSTDRVNWTDEAWTVTTTTENIGPQMIDTTLAYNLNSETTFVAFVITGDLYLFDYWYIDDISITRTPKLHLFVKSTVDTGIWMNPMASNETFEGWELMPGGTSTTPTVGVFNNRLHLVVKDTVDDKMWYRSMDATSTWGDWSQLSGFSPSTASMAAFNNKLYLVVRGSNDLIYYRAMDTGGVWGNWSVMPGATTTPPVVAVFNGKLHLVVKSSTNMDIWWNSMDTTETWTGWQQLSGLTPGPVAMAEYNSRLYMFVRGSDDRIYYRSLDTEGTWGDWSGMYGWTTISPTVGAFNGRLYLFVKASVGDSIYMRSMDAEETWGDWSMISGATTIPMVVAIF